MSAETEQSAASPCDQLLDYAYDELSGAALTAFEAHLATCAKCQADLAAMKRVRGAVHTALPMVEPPAAATGGLHAQLLHAAAQRTATKAAPRGKMLAFVRRVATHPGYAAAAGALIIGGAIGLQWSRGALFMAPKEAQPAMASAPAPSTEAVAATPPVLPENAPPENEKTVAENEKKPAGFADKAGAPAKEGASDDMKLLQPKLDGYSSSQGSKKSAESKVFLGAVDKQLSVRSDPPPKSRSKIGYQLDSANGQGLLGPKDNAPAAADEDSASSGSVGSVGDVYARGGGGAAGKSDANAQNPGGYGGRAATGKVSSALSTKGAPSGSAGGTWNAQPSSPAYQSGSTAPAPVAAAAPAPPPPPTEKPVVRGESQQAYDGRSQAASTSSLSKNHAAAANQAQAPSTPAPQQSTLARNAEALRKKADELASTGRCDEAVRLYSELERTYPSFRIAPQDRLPYVRCLRLTGRTDKALDELEVLKRDKSVTNRAIDEESRQLMQAQQPASAKPSAAPPAPSRMAAEPQQKSEAPAQQAESVRTPAPTTRGPAKAKKAKPADDAALKPAF